MAEKLTDRTETPAGKAAWLLHIVDTDSTPVSFKIQRQNIYGQDLDSTASVAFAKLTTSLIESTASADLEIEPTATRAVSVILQATNAFNVKDSANTNVISVNGNNAVATRLALYGTGLTSANIGHLAAMNQNVATNSNVTFNQLTATAQVFISNGSAGAPSIAFTSSTTTGIYRNAANQLAIAVSGNIHTAFSANTITLQVATPTLLLVPTAAPSDSFRFRVVSNDGQIAFTRNSGNGVISIDAIVTDTVSSSTIEVARNTNTSGGAQLSFFFADGTTNLRHYLNLKSGTSGFALDAGSSIAIGASTANAKLHVRGAGTAMATGGGQLYVQNSANTTDSAGMTIYSGNAAVAFVNFGDPQSLNPGAIFYDHARNAFDFRVNSATRVTMGSNGFVGIGTTTPEYNLHIEGTNPTATVINSSSSAGTLAAVRIWSSADNTRSTNGDAVLQLAGKATAGLPDNCWYMGLDGSSGPTDFAPELRIGFAGSWAKPGDGDRIIVTAAGKVSVGVANPDGSSALVQLRYNSGNGQINFARVDGTLVNTIFCDASNYLHFQNGTGSSRIYINTNSNSTTAGVWFRDVNGPIDYFFSNTFETNFTSGVVTFYDTTKTFGALRIFSEPASYSDIWFNDGADRGNIRYVHSTDVMELRTANARRAVIGTRVTFDVPVALPAGAPATATSSGAAGELAYDGTHFYVCVSANVWRRVAISTF